MVELESAILDNVDWGIANKQKNKWWCSPGGGKELIEVLKTVITPEEIIRDWQKYGITAKQYERFIAWFQHNCSFNKAGKQFGLGPNFFSAAIIDNGSSGIFTKIRRHIVKWKPWLDENDEMQYLSLDYMEEPIILFQDTDDIIFKREATRIPGSLSNDPWYGKNPVCYSRIDNEWKLMNPNHPRMVEIFNAIKLADLFTGYEGMIV